MTATVTTVQAARCLDLLKQADEPIVAAELARRLGLGGSRESRRRHVRRLIEHLRQTGAWIVATHQAGYALTDDPHVWNDYLEGKQIDAKRIFGETYRHQRMLAEGGQGLLFSINKGGYA